MASEPRFGPLVPDTPAQLPSYDISHTGRFVTIVPFSPDYAEDLYNSLQLPDNAALFDYLSDYPPESLDAFRTAFANKADIKDRWTYIILLNRGSERPKAVGRSSLRVDLPNRVIEIGHVLFTPALQRTPAATEAMYLLAKYVFETLGFRRYEWKCNSLNAPSRRAALRLGFTYEGLLRQHMIHKGRNRDTMWFSMLDVEWPAIKAAMERWLAPENFDEDGKQKKRLEDFRI